MGTLVAVQAQVFRTCPGPKQFKAQFERFEYKGRMEKVTGRFAYDEDTKRIAEIEDETFKGGNRTVYRKLKLYNENKEYSLDLKTRNCTVYPPHPRWHPYGAPPDAKLVFDATVGAVGVTGEHVVAAVFESKFDNNDTFTVTVSEPLLPHLHKVVRYGQRWQTRL